MGVYEMVEVALGVLRMDEESQVSYGTVVSAPERSQNRFRATCKKALQRHLRYLQVNLRMHADVHGCDHAGIHGRGYAVWFMTFVKDASGQFLAHFQYVSEQVRAYLNQIRLLDVFLKLLELAGVGSQTAAMVEADLRRWWESRF